MAKVAKTLAQNAAEVEAGLTLPNKAEACRQHIKSLETPIDVLAAHAAFKTLWAGTFLGDLPKNHYRFYVNEMGIEVASGRKGAFSAAGGEEDESTAGEMMTLKVEMNETSDIDPTLLIPLRTNTPFDNIVSKRQGCMPGTVNMITGESGAGKTTISVNVADAIKRNNPGKTAGMLQGEMNRLDWAEECLDNPSLRKMAVIFLLDYLDAPNFVELVEEALGMWDFVIVDSFEVILEQIKETKGWTGKKAEKELINMLNRIAELGKCLFVIQHYTKAGTYAGSTKLKHLTTSMIFVMFDKTGERFVIFTKNRRCGHMVNKPLYFTKSKVTGELEFDGKRFENEQAVVQHIDNEKAAVKEEGNIFESMRLRIAAGLPAIGAAEAAAIDADGTSEGFNEGGMTIAA